MHVTAWSGQRGAVSSPASSHVAPVCGRNAATGPPSKCSTRPSAAKKIWKHKEFVFSKMISDMNFQGEKLLRPTKKLYIGESAGFR